MEGYTQDMDDCRDPSGKDLLYVDSTFLLGEPDQMVTC
jgi:hypothetical protein